MANFNTEYTNVSAINNHKGINYGNRDYSATSNTTFGSYALVGINTKLIPDMKKAIDTYVKEMNVELKTIKAAIDPTIAFKGTSIEPAIQDYINSVFNYVVSICRKLLAFDAKLDEIAKAWESSDMNISSKVSSGSDELRKVASSVEKEE